MSKAAATPSANLDRVEQGTSATARHSRTRRLLALVERPLGRAPNQRFRHEQWAPHLERDHGIQIEFAPFESPELGALMDAPGRRGRKLLLALRDTARRWMTRHEAMSFDGVVVLREASLLGGAWLERYLARNGVPFIYDFDDAIFVDDPDVGDWTTRLWRKPSKVAEICRLANAVTVGNEYLAAYARQHNADVSTVRTSIDLDRFQMLAPNDGTLPFTVVWTGSRSTLQYLDLARPALSRLGARMPLRLRVICDEPPAHAFENVNLDFVRWSPAVEVSALAAGDAGIMPLPDTQSARGKCGCKALQYMAVGRPAVVSPIGINREIVRDGENGLLAGSADEWVGQLERLARDPVLRERLVAEGRRTVEAGFSAQASASAFADVVRRVVAPIR